MTRLACKICVLTKGITLRDTFATEAELLDHIQSAHGDDAAFDEIDAITAREKLPTDRCFVLPNGECVSPFECVHGPADPAAVAALQQLGETVAAPRGLFARGASSSALIPVATAEAVAKQHGLKQVILVAWDGDREHVVTYGSTLGDADNAAQGGNLVKTALRWPSSRYSTSDRVAALVNAANDLLNRLSTNASDPLAKTDHWREFATLRDLLVMEGFRS